MKTTNLAIRLGVAALALLASASLAHAQAYKAPRTAYGAPDLEGTWTNASITGLERPASMPGLVISEEQAKRMEAQAIARSVAGDRPTDPNAPPPTVGGDVGGYNAGWTDPGTKVGRIRGQARGSWIIDPADGRLPYTAAGKAAFAKQLAYARETFDGPEARPLGERCILGFGSTAGPPMLNVLYNNNYQFVQTKDQIAILVEMNHDVRIIRLNTKDHLPPHVRPWMGDSIGWWEGDSLVVETTNFNLAEGLRPNMSVSYFMSPDAKVTERFTRVAADQILYEFSVDDPKTFTRVWKAEMALNATKGPIYEYACHEGNHALDGILAGARQDEKAGRKTAAVDLGE
ncbi:hypothetical protein BH11PSE2_BH11PSE2_14720 [soil metagenome]